MRIAFLAAANSIHSVRWIKFFADRGHEIAWISLAPPIPETEALLRSLHDRERSGTKKTIKNLNFYEIKPSPLSDINGPFAICSLPHAVVQLKKILRDAKPDLLHVHSAGTYGLVAALVNFHPMVLTPWGSDILINSGIKKNLVEFTVKCADAYTCDGNNTFQKLIELGAKKEKIHLVRFGTDVKKFGPSTTHNPQPTTFKIISLRSLEPIYDIETLIKAAAIVTQKNPNVEFIIAGDGSQKERLEGSATSLNLTTSHVVRFRGKVRNEELPALLQSTDIYVSTALSDSGLSASTAEAMASGLPVIVTDTGDNKQWVNSPAGGFVIPIKNPEILAEKIISLVKNKKLRKTQGVRNRKIIEEKNNYYVEMKKTEKIYENIVKNKS